MSICDSEENRKKLAWLVPGYILLAWFFCVLFQPLGVHHTKDQHGDHQKPEHYPSSYGGSNSLRSSLSSNQIYSGAGDKNYEVIYLDSNQVLDHCSDNGSVITLSRGAKSAILIRFGHFFHYNNDNDYDGRRGRRRQQHHRPRNPHPFNCSIRIEVDTRSLDGLSAVVEEMSLKGRGGGEAQQEDHCQDDYIEVYSDYAKVRNRLCGTWNVGRNSPLQSQGGPNQTLVGYCYDDHSGHSCETTAININVVIGQQYSTSGDRDEDEDEPNRLVLDPGLTAGLSHRNPYNTPVLASSSRAGSSRDRRGFFTLAVTGYRHPKAEEGYHCNDLTEFTCDNNDFSIHREKQHCVWKELQCDFHQNCGFSVNQDEEGCGSSGVVGPAAVGGGAGGSIRVVTSSSSSSWWSISTMTLLIVTYLAIILVLVLLTLLFLRWHKGLAAAAAAADSSSSSGSDANNSNNPDVVAVSQRTYNHVVHGPSPNQFSNFASREADLTLNAAGPSTALTRLPGTPSPSAAAAAAAAALGTTATTTTTNNGISIMVMYKPRSSYEAPPSYDSLFTGTSASLSLPTAGAAAADFGRATSSAASVPLDLAEGVVSGAAVSAEAESENTAGEQQLSAVASLLGHPISSNHLINDDNIISIPENSNSHQQQPQLLDNNVHLISVSEVGEDVDDDDGQRHRRCDNGQLAPV